MAIERKRTDRVISLNGETMIELEKAQMEIEAHVGFKPTLAQTIAHLLKHRNIIRWDIST